MHTTLTKVTTRLHLNLTALTVQDVRSSLCSTFYPFPLSPLSPLLITGLTSPSPYQPAHFLICLFITDVRSGSLTRQQENEGRAKRLGELAQKYHTQQFNQNTQNQNTQNQNTQNQNQQNTSQERSEQKQQKIQKSVSATKPPRTQRGNSQQLTPRQHHPGINLFFSSFFFFVFSLLIILSQYVSHLWLVLIVACSCH